VIKTLRTDPERKVGPHRTSAEFCQNHGKQKTMVFLSHVSGFNEGNFGQVMYKMQLIRNGWCTPFKA